MQTLMTQPLRVQYESVWSKPIKEYMVEDKCKFFHRCLDCMEEKVHICKDDHDPCEPLPPGINLPTLELIPWVVDPL